MKAFVARPRSKALGAVEGADGNPLPHGPITGDVNMRTLFDFGLDESDHSVQFNRRIQQLDGLYSRISELIR
jgi:hypothetical protein